VRAQHSGTRVGGGYRHEALIYSSEDELLEVAVPFLRAGVSAGEPTLLRLDAPRQAVVLDALGDTSGVTICPHADRLTPLSVLRTTYELITQLTSNGGAATARMLGEVPQQPWPAWARYEAAINAAFGSLPAWGICPYDARTTPAAVLADVELTHPILSTPGDLTGVENPLFQDPQAFLDEHAGLPDLLQSTRPDAELTDPAPGWAGEIVSILAADTRLEAEERDSLRLATTATVKNARDHGRPPIRVRIWTAADCVIVTVADAGLGADDLLSGVLQDGPSVETSRSLYHVREAVSDVSMFWGPDGFTVRLVQRRR